MQHKTVRAEEVAGRGGDIAQSTTRYNVQNGAGQVSILLTFPGAALTGRQDVQQLRQLGDIGGDAQGLVAGREGVRRRASSGLILEIGMASRTMQQASVSSTDQGGGRSSPIPLAAPVLF
jgi:hypothetical protein